ncbi:hypothetical protein AAZX31_08G306500 [Glycine max]
MHSLGTNGPEWLLCCLGEQTMKSRTIGTQGSNAAKGRVSLSIQMSMINTMVPQHQPPPTTPFPCLTPTGSNPNIATSFELFNQNQQHHQQQQQYQYQQKQQYQQHPLSPTASHHSPLSSPLQHRQPFTSSSPHNFLDHSPLPLSSYSSPSPLSFTFQRPAPMLSTPLRFKRYCASPSYKTTSLTLLSPPNSLTLMDSGSLFHQASLSFFSPLC